MFKLKESLKHDLATAVNQKEYNQNMSITAQYEGETVQARLESMREEREMISDFKREVE